ncbi:hypothetical protein L8O13_15030 [Enterobacter roggenkampii]|nr:hypothetical protein [Enterobacter roggenkampii]
MSFDCVIIKPGVIPSIHQVDSDKLPFTVTYDERKTYETFSITKIEHAEKTTGKHALYLVADKANTPRELITAIIDDLQPTPVKYFS